jgi:hypothetical protein
MNTIYKYIALIAIIGLLFLGGIILFKQYKKYKNLYYISQQNVEAYQIENSDSNNKLRQYQLTIDELRCSNDSIDKKLLKVVDELKIKDKRIEALQYQQSEISKVDTIIFKDTLFQEGIKIDTAIIDPWYSLELSLKYPSEIKVSPTFKNEQYVIINTKKEYNNKRSKIFFIRWFQKKHLVTEVNIEEKSPYVTNKKSKFVKVIK